MPTDSAIMRGRGFSDAQAEAMADEQTQLLDNNLVTKDDISQLATKIELAKMVTKTDFKVEFDKMVTKDDISQLATKIELDKMVTKTDFKIELDKMATKADIIQVKYEVIKWMTGTTFALAALILGVLPLLIKAG